LDSATFTFWLSKLSTVTVRAGGKSRSLQLGHGTQSFTWSPRGLPPGPYKPFLTAIAANGYRTTATLHGVEPKAAAPPVVEAHVGGLRTLFWSATDEGTPWLHLTVRLDNGTKIRYRDLGHLPLAGRAVVVAPPGTWHATLVAGNSARQAVTIDLGSITGR